MSDLKKLLSDFNSDGFAVVKKVLPISDIENILNAFERLYNFASSLNSKNYLGKESHVIFEDAGLNRIVWCGGLEDILLEYGAHPNILTPVTQILGSKELTQIINQAHFKMPGEKIEFNWHQDSEHRRYGTDKWTDVSGKGSYVQTLIAIDKMTLENGPLKLIRGSHKNGHIDLKNHPERINQFSEEDIVRLEMEPGDMALFGPYTIHSSSINHSNGPRRVFINGFCIPGANNKEYPGIGLGRTLSL